MLQVKFAYFTIVKGSVLCMVTSLKKYFLCKYCIISKSRYLYCFNINAKENNLFYEKWLINGFIM